VGHLFSEPGNTAKIDNKTEVSLAAIVRLGQQYSGAAPGPDLYFFTNSLDGHIKVAPFPWRHSGPNKIARSRERNSVFLFSTRVTPKSVTRNN
jgi:hypothetical protein